MSVAFKLSNIECDSISDCVSLDADYLKRNTFGEKALRDEIVGLFLAQLDGVTKTFGAPIDKTAWQFTSHTLKGAAAAVGACQIAALAEQWGRDMVPNTQVERDICKRWLENLVAEFKAAANRL
jgi:Hpt domain